MFAYLVTVIFFAIQFLFSLFINKKVNKFKKSEKLIKEELNHYIETIEPEYPLSKMNIFRLKMLELFTKIDDEDKKEEIREKMKSIVKANNGKPLRTLLLQYSTLLFSAICIYLLILVVHTAPIYWFSLIVNILVIFLWISRKRWIFSIVLGVFGYFVYPYIPSHIILFIGLNTTIGFKIKQKKEEQNK